MGYNGGVIVTLSLLDQKFPGSSPTAGAKRSLKHQKENRSRSDKNRPFKYF